jgi:predicted nucleic acid-binding protein
MSYLLDTCVLSEFTKRQPDARVVAWVALYHHLSLVTRNGADFQVSGVSLVNPWVSVV